MLLRLLAAGYTLDQGFIKNEFNTIMQDIPHYVKLTETVAAASQIQVADLAAIAAAGYQVVINNRPDGEAMGQPSSEEMRAAAASEGLEYHYYPLNAFNYPGPDLSAMAELFDGSRPVFAFCRSGTRSSNLWISSRSVDEQDKARQHAQQLGFDVSISISMSRR
ncbi:MAG: hypothetical protein ACI8RN_001652 [Glaciecola sp.]